jgi:hypothetical protein
MTKNNGPCSVAAGGSAMSELDGVASVADVARMQALRRGSTPALVFEGRAMTFADVDALASRLANALIASGVRTQARIAYLSKNTDHFLPCLMGACKARAALAPFNFRFAAPEIARLFEDSEARIMFVGPDVVDLADQAVGSLASKPRMIALGFDRQGYERHDTWIESAAPEDPRLEADPQDDVFQLYTSGTTGLPKGVQLTNCNYLAAFEQASASGRLNYEPGETVLAAMPFFSRRRRQYRADRNGERRAFGDPQGRCAAAHSGRDWKGEGQSRVPRASAHSYADAGPRNRERRPLQHDGSLLRRFAHLRGFTQTRKRAVSLRVHSGLWHDRSLRPGNLPRQRGS